MAVTQSPFCNPSQYGVSIDTASVSAPVANIRGGPTTLCVLKAVSSAGQKNFIKLYDATSVVAGTTDPTWILPIPAGVNQTMQLGLSGRAFLNGLTSRTVQSAGTAGTTDPGGGAVALHFYTKDSS